MLPVELPVEHIVAATLQLGDDAATAAVYRKHPVAHAVEDKYARGAGPPGRAMSPGENASTCVKRSPLVIPKESA